MISKPAIVDGITLRWVETGVDMDGMPVIVKLKSDQPVVCASENIV